VNEQIIDEAAAWLVEFSSSEVSAETKKAFDLWLRKSPEHVRIYLEILPIWDDAALALPGDRTSAEDLIALARGAENVVQLSVEARSELAASIDRLGRAVDVAPSVDSLVAEARGHRLTRWHYSTLAASIAFLLLGVIVLWWRGYHLPSYTPTYTTRVGEHRSVTLTDGSTVELNTRTRLRVRFTSTARRVELLEGQALFRVSKDPLRPFSVASGTTDVRAVGTQFDVYRKSNGTTVTVLEGKVAVASVASPVIPPTSAGQVSTPTPEGTEPRPSAPNVAVLLSAGERITMTPTTMSATPAPADVSAAAAWTAPWLYSIFLTRTTRVKPA